MQILIFSDIHDHIENMRVVVEKVRGQVQAAIFCGDFCAPFSAAQAAELDVPIYACLGNNDEDHIGLLKKGGEKIGWTHLSEEFGVVELDNKKIAFCHYPKLAELLANTGDYDAVFHGHTHQVRDEKLGETILVNPGSICGIKRGKYIKPSYAIYDTDTDSVSIERFNNNE